MNVTMKDNDENDIAAVFIPDLDDDDAMQDIEMSEASVSARYNSHRRRILRSQFLLPP